VSFFERIWAGLTTIIKIDDKVTTLAARNMEQQAKIENLTERMIRVETLLEIAMATGNKGAPPPKQLR
jgi:hypothetical protein